MDAPAANPPEFPAALLDALRRAHRITALTGAGVSAESGVPTFRDAQTGLWAQYRPEELATPTAFRTDPRLVWEWYAWRRELVAQAAPNPAHYALAEIERRSPGFVLITQNVDGLHQRAGSGQVAPLLELHGNIQRVRCSEENTPVDSWAADGQLPPRCPHCGGLLRPDVVWFEEALPAAALDAAWRAAGQSEVFLTIGTSALVQPAASLPLAAARSGALLVEINPQPTPLTDQADFVLSAPAGVCLPRLVKAAWGG